MTVRTINIRSYGHFHANFIAKLGRLEEIEAVFSGVVPPSVLFGNILNKLIK